MLLIIEKLNPVFRNANNSKQPSGLNTCFKMIAGINPKKIKHSIVTNNRDILRAVGQHQARTVILQSIWATDSFLKELTETLPGTRFIIWLQSNIPFFVVEGPVIYNNIAIAKKYGVEIACNDLRAAKGLGAIYLPNIYEPSLEARPEKKLDLKNKEVLSIACAGALRNMKNTPIQALAAIRFAEANNKKLRFYINSSRTDGVGSTLYALQAIFKNNLDHELLSMPWMEHRELIEFLHNEIDIGMQASMTESFNITSCDYVHAGLPIVVSKEVRWLKNRRSIVEDIGDIESYLKTFDKIKKGSDIKRNREDLAAHNEKAKRIWLSL